jgi:ribosomal protein S18 acetylase RimI-like enzyme
LPPERANTLEYTISPLTFLQIYQTANVFFALLLEQDTALQRRLGSSVVLRTLARAVALPLYYHYGTSGYGMFVGEAQVGWLYLRGRQQVVYIDALAVHPDWRGRGVDGELLHFAERQMRELRREWLGLTVALDDEAALHFYESQGYHREHWRIMRSGSDRAILPQPGGAIHLRPVVGMAAGRAYHRFAQIDLAAGEALDAAVQPSLLNHNPHWRPGHDWLVVYEGKSIAYLNKHGTHAHPAIFLACDPAWWGSPQTLGAISLALANQGSIPPGVDIRLGSSKHHDAARSMLEQSGFAEYPATTTRMFKRLRIEKNVQPEPGRQDVL